MLIITLYLDNLYPYPPIFIIYNLGDIITTCSTSSLHHFINTASGSKLAARPSTTCSTRGDSICTHNLSKLLILQTLSASEHGSPHLSPRRIDHVVCIHVYRYRYRIWWILAMHQIPDHDIGLFIVPVPASVPLLSLSLSLPFFFYFFF